MDKKQLIDISRYLGLLRLLIKIWIREDRLLYFYFGSIFLFITSFYTNNILLCTVFFSLSCIYLAHLYTKDKSLSIFYKVFNISALQIHIAKVFPIYCLSLVLLFITIRLYNRMDTILQIVSAHFLSFYALLLAFNRPNFIKLLFYIFCSLSIAVLLLVLPFYIVFAFLFITISILLAIMIKNFINKNFTSV